MPEVSVIIPAYNEAKRIDQTIRSVKSIPEVTEIIVVDDGSLDATAERAKEAGAQVLRLPRNRGKGAALAAGVEAAKGEILLFLDADLGESAVQARNLLLPVLEGKADMTVAVFPAPRHKGGFGLVRGLARAGVRWLTGQEVKAPLSGQRAIRREALEKLLPFASGFGVEVALTVKALRQGLRVCEVKLDMRHRETGRSLADFWHRGRQFKDVLFTLGRLLLGGKKV
ncbi:glycosyl transferase family 2 [Ammonifex degensii KC4]|uniref:Glucosyl-3-phosphoglycerate synthase n=1 Tax=Ammonifex degensii (strain DSM 10501 / KC4) TaxID=429009 RepID=C9R862_AMMDK|nr:glycosyltransferase family 2 protein [Ammonifex degensii]ACX52491.1 glycosyl transferase family 2 [Ammonifex degensii KC4]